MDNAAVKGYNALKTQYKVEYFGLSDIGLMREYNEDAWLAIPENGMFILADGMGGHKAGEVAANDAVHLLADLSEDLIKTHSEDDLWKAFVHVNSQIFQKGQKDEGLSGMGTTLCCLFIHQQKALYAHVGDSRVYRLRKERLNQLTDDHSLVNELVGLGAIQKEEADTFPYKHVLTKAMGTHPHVDPSVSTSALQINDLFLLCSDGLTNLVTDQQIETILNQNTTLAIKAQKLVDLAKKHGGGDNITVLLVKVEDE